MSNTAQKEQNAETVGGNGALGRIRTPDLLIRRAKSNISKQYDCVTRSLNVRGECLRVTDTSNTIYQKVKIPDASYVYILQCKDFIKVGVSKNPKKRLAQIQTCNPNHVDLAYAHMCPEACSKDIEKMVHEKLSKHRVNGEWFSCSAETVIKHLQGFDAIRTQALRLSGCKIALFAVQKAKSKSSPTTYKEK